MGDERRQQIIEAARAILVDNPRATLSVRAVAEQAGVGASTLRYHFPTQRTLHEEVFAAFFDATAGDLRIHDSSVPAHLRLRECLSQLLPPAQPTELPLDGWLGAMASAFGSTAAPEARAGWFASVVQTRRQIVGWLGVLAQEGHVAGGSEDRAARMLMVVLDGLAFARVIPASRLTPEEETAALDDAIAAVLR